MSNVAIIMFRTFIIDDKYGSESSESIIKSFINMHRFEKQMHHHCSRSNNCGIIKALGFFLPGIQIQFMSAAQLIERIIVKNSTNDNDYNQYKDKVVEILQNIIDYQMDQQ